MEKIDKTSEEAKISSFRVSMQERDTVSPTFGKFPMNFWIEWDKDCEQNYNGTRWVKAWADHSAAKEAMKREAMWEYMMKLNDKLDTFMAQPQQVSEPVDDYEDESFVPTLGNPTKKRKVMKNE